MYPATSATAAVDTTTVPFVVRATATGTVSCIQCPTRLCMTATSVTDGGVCLYVPATANLACVCATSNTCTLNSGSTSTYVCADGQASACVTPPTVTPAPTSCEAETTEDTCKASSTATSSCSWCAASNTASGAAGCHAFCQAASPATGTGTVASAGAAVAADPGSVAAAATQGINAAVDPTTFPFTVIMLILQTVNDNGVAKLTLKITCTGAGTLTSDNEAYLRNLLVQQLAASVDVDPSQVSVSITFVSYSKRAIFQGVNNVYNGNANFTGQGSSGTFFGSSVVMIALSVFLSFWFAK